MGSKVLGIVMVCAVGAIIGDFLAHPSGSSNFFNGVNGLATSSYQAASGAYA